MQNINSLSRESFPRSQHGFARVSLKTRFLLGFSSKMRWLFGGLALGFFLVGMMYFIQAAIFMQHQDRQRNIESAQQTLLDIAVLLAMPTLGAESINNVLSQLDTLMLDTRFDSPGNISADIAALKQSLTQHLIEQKQLIVSNASLDFMELKALADFKSRVAIVLANIHAYIEADNAKAVIAAEQKFIFLMAMFVIMLMAVFMGLALAIYQFDRDAGQRINHINNVIKRINKGKLNTRIDVLEHDALGKLSTELNRFLDKHFQLLESQSSESEQLNNSIVSLIRAVGIIARKDLTVKVPVSVDITGSISDAVNLLTSETARTLALVKNISQEVDSVADVLHDKSQTVLNLAEQERIEVMATVNALEHSTLAMNDIASKAGIADVLAKTAIANTRQARVSVEQSFNRISIIKSTMAETEKRIKRLGDRSHEVSGIVNLINTIAERTHILALNASMHAASAGEAGKGFALVAAEVQRLAENVREATADIASMVHNIRIETSDAVVIMNRLMMEVVEGTKIAEMAGQHMSDTDLATHELVSLVSVMGENAIRQAAVTQNVRDRANIIRDFTQKTGAQLLDQNSLTANLKVQSEALVEQVGLFKLPKAKNNAPTLLTSVS